MLKNNVYLLLLFYFFSKPEGTSTDETLTLAKHVLYPLENVQLGWTNSDWAVGCGMVNMGNTCYLNSTLQALFHVPALVNWLISDKQHVAKCEESGKNKYMANFRLLIVGKIEATLITSFYC